MDGLSAAASGMAVVSLAIQLGDSVKKLCEFWDSVIEAPGDIGMILADLELLSNILAEIAREEQHSQPDNNLVLALNGCWSYVNILTALLDKMEPGFASRSSCVRRWTAVKAVMKSRDLAKFQEALERVKCTLLLVQQHRSR